MATANGTNRTRSTSGYAGGTRERVRGPPIRGESNAVRASASSASRRAVLTCAHPREGRLSPGGVRVVGVTNEVVRPGGDSWVAKGPADLRRRAAAARQRGACDQTVTCAGVTGVAPRAGACRTSAGCVLQRLVDEGGHR